jgi:hypothetical protein
MRKEYKMTKEQMEKLLDSCKPVPYMIIGDVMPRSPQENANYAWCSLGKEMGFDGMTVEPSSKGQEYFTAMETMGENSKAIFEALKPA